MTLEQVSREIVETISDSIVITSDDKACLSRTARIKIETLLIEFANELRQDILDTVWREYIK